MPTHGLVEVRKSFCEQRHVDGARRPVDDGDTDEEQRRGEQVHHDVAHARADLGGLAPVGEQHIAGDEDQLERHEEREEIAGEHREGDAARQHE
jgi:hypothetical protein